MPQTTSDLERINRLVLHETCKAETQDIPLSDADLKRLTVSLAMPRFDFTQLSEIAQKAETSTRASSIPFELSEVNQQYLTDLRDRSRAVLDGHFSMLSQCHLTLAEALETAKLTSDAIAKLASFSGGPIFCIHPRLQRVSGVPERLSHLKSVLLVGGVVGAQDAEGNCPCARILQYSHE